MISNQKPINNKLIDWIGHCNFGINHMNIQGRVTPSPFVVGEVGPCGTCVIVLGGLVPP